MSFKRFAKVVLFALVFLALGTGTKAYAAEPVESTAALKSGWVQEGGNWYFYNTKTHKMEKNKIVGNKSGGYYYVAPDGTRVNDRTTNAAVRFVRKNTSSKQSASKRLNKCVKILIKKYKFKNLGDATKVQADYLEPAAYRFFKKKNGNCYCHAADVAYIAKVLGYKDIQIRRGELYGYGNKYTICYHGWCMVKKNKVVKGRIQKKWCIYDLTFQRRQPKKKLTDVIASKYPYKLKTLKIFTLKAGNGKITWQ